MKNRSSIMKVMVAVLITLAIAAMSASAQKISMNEVFKNLELQPGQQATWFIDNVRQDAVRWFTAVPNGYRPGAFGSNELVFVNWDSQIEVTKVFYILKGDDHSRDGSGGARTLQVNITVKNLDLARPVIFSIYQAEISSK